MFAPLACFLVDPMELHASSPFPAGGPTDRIVIIGAGVAGCALAYALAKQGIDVFLLERDLTEPDRVVGEFLQPGGVFALQQLGFESCLEGIDACALRGCSVFRGTEPLPADYPTIPGRPTSGLAFHHGRFVQNLRAMCRTMPDRIHIVEGTATQLVFVSAENGSERSVVRGVRYRAKGDASGEVKELLSVLTVVCDGAGSLFRKAVSPHSMPTVNSHFVALLLQLQPEQIPSPGYAHVFVNDNINPVLLYQIAKEKNEHRMLIDVKTPLPNVASGELKQFVASKIVPAMPTQIQTAVLEALETGRIRSMPNQVMPAVRYPSCGAILLGDSFNSRHPLTAGGMTVALHDAILLAKLVSNARESRPIDKFGEDNLCAILESFCRDRKPVANSINMLSCVLYTAFSTSADPGVSYLRESAFGYFRRGKDCVDGPMGLLGGLTPGIGFLAYHFGRMALFGIGSTISTSGLRGVWQSLAMVRTALTTILPLVWQYAM